MDDLYGRIASAIIEQQETIIGPVAVEQARHVSGLAIDWNKHSVQVKGDAPKTIDELVRQYEHLFGRLSVDVCRDAAAQLVAQLPADKQPTMLKA